MEYATIFLQRTSSNNKKFNKYFWKFFVSIINLLAFISSSIRTAGLPSLEINNLPNVSWFYFVWSLHKNTISLRIYLRELVFIIQNTHNKFVFFMNCISLDHFFLYSYRKCIEKYTETNYINNFQYIFNYLAFLFSYVLNCIISK